MPRLGLCAAPLLAVFLLACGANPDEHHHATGAGGDASTTPSSVGAWMAPVTGPGSGGAGGVGGAGGMGADSAVANAGADRTVFRGDEIALNGYGIFIAGSTG